MRSAKDPGEQQAEEALDPAPDLVVSTAGKEGGEWVGEDRTDGTWKAAELPGRRRTPTAPATPSRPASRSASAPTCRSSERSRSPRAAGAHKLAGRAAYDGQLTAADL